MGLEASVQRVIRTRVRESMDVLGRLLEDEAFLQKVADAAVAMTAALNAGRKVFFFGNGGSAADAEHLAAELSGRFLRERRSLPAWTLTTNASTLTAIANDYSYDLIYARQIEGVGNPGDVAFGISTSGRSPNVVRAMDVAHTRGMVTIGLTGGEGGDLRSVVDYCISVPSVQTPRVQEAHILAGHILCELIEEALFGGSLDLDEETGIARAQGA